MAYTDLNETQQGANVTYIKDYSVDSKSLDAGEIEYINPKAAQQMGYYRTIPELRTAVDTKAIWTVGRGIKAVPETELALMGIKGAGKDTIHSILSNLIRVYHVCGDAFAEIIREGEQLVNLKPLDSSKVKIVSDKKGLIKRYEVRDSNGAVVKIAPEDMFHLSRLRVADEIHGISLIEAVEWIILARNEALSDNKTALHRNVYPTRLWHLDTDDTSKITAFKNKVAEAKYKGEDVFIPKGSVETEIASVPQNSSMNPLPWIMQLNQYFYQAVGVPQIIIGGSQEITQTAAQIAYLAFEQTIAEEQLYVKEQFLSQLDLEIELEFPASLQNNLLSDAKKDGTEQQQANQPSQLAPPMTRGGM